MKSFFALEILLSGSYSEAGGPVPHRSLFSDREIGIRDLGPLRKTSNGGDRVFYLSVKNTYSIGSKKTCMNVNEKTELNVNEKTELNVNEKTESNEPKPYRVPKAVSRYMRELAYRGAAKIRGTQAAHDRAKKARAARTRKEEERLAAEAAKTAK